MSLKRLVCLLFSPLSALAGEQHASPPSLTDLDLATLMNMDVTITSAARRAQISSDAAAAVFVITREDIRRSGATSIPELLRGVPGLQVARETNSHWAVTARGFNSRFANKLLVLIDGRSVYTQQYSGVAWEQQHVPLDEIERIEIVRGPGGALWGANAVNGIINIITRTAVEGAGLRVTAGTGNEDHGAASLHYGDQAGRFGAYRGYVEQFDRDSLRAAAPSWRHLQAGWRFDGQTDKADYTLQGDVYHSEPGTISFAGTPLGDIADRGGNLNFNWDGDSFASGRLSLQSSYSYRSHATDLSFEKESAFDLNFQYNAVRLGRHLLTLGGGFRLLSDAGYLDYTPESSDRRQSSLYAQDEIYFFSDALRFTFGAKVEDSDYTGTSLQPTARALWHATATQTVWSAISRAVRTPSRFERGAHAVIFAAPGNPQYQIVLAGNPDLSEEHLTATELGWRWRPSDHWSFDLALFDHDYSHLAVTRSLPLQFNPGPPATLLQIEQSENVGRAHTVGAEGSIDWIVNPWLRLQANSSWFHMDAPSLTIIGFAREGADPEQSYALRARMDLPRRAELDLSWRHVGGLPTANVPAYGSFDARFGWQPVDRLELSVCVDNVLNREHIEFANEEEDIVPGDVIGRTFFLRATWRSGR